MDEKKLNGQLKAAVDTLSEEQKKKAAACETVQDLIAFLTEAGVELPDELLDAVSGGKGIRDIVLEVPIVLKEIIPPSQNTAFF